ncbi:MAG: type II toxin-antitoxin system VapC family toxin [Bryobacterales bacterium]|nr:type II toxin-antitoxin system VapC family toxin [Bryobacterales bacterium]MBV9401645.1 type II toxin-antitoxin system VapC family toxin [Bryobacterales bacterium]
MTRYADTSFLVALYLPDSNTEAAAAELGVKLAPVSMTTFTIFEFVNAVSARRFRGDISAREMDSVLAGFREDIARGSYENKSLPDRVWERAAALAEAHTPRLGIRALDVLHVAIATDLGASTFYTFDERQRKLARAVGLHVRPVRI